MDNFVDIKQEIKDEERKDFINKIKGSSPVRGKTIKIKKDAGIIKRNEFLAKKTCSLKYKSYGVNPTPAKKIAPIKKSVAPKIER